MNALTFTEIESVAGGRLLGDVGFYMAGVGTMMAAIPGAQIPAATLLLGGGVMMIADAVFN